MGHGRHGVPRRRADKKSTAALIKAFRHIDILATDRLSDFKLGTGDEIKRLRTGAASVCLKLQCIAIATFSSIQSNVLRFVNIN